MANRNLAMMWTLTQFSLTGLPARHEAGKAKNGQFWPKCRECAPRGACGASHQAGMEYRDIKPANLLVNKDGLVKVADLGLVKVPEREEIADGDVSDQNAVSASQDITKLRNIHEITSAF